MVAENKKGPYTQNVKVRLIAEKHGYSVHYNWSLVQLIENWYIAHHKTISIYLFEKKQV